MAWQSGKKADVGFKGLGGVLSTSKDFNWSNERYGLSPNQLPSDIWLKEVPVVQHGGSGNISTPAHASLVADNNAFITEYDTSSPVRLVREDAAQGGSTMGHSNTLWMARDGLTGNRLRNWINPSNHLDSTGAVSLGYTVRIFKDDGNGAIDTGSEVYLTSASMFFYYKEGALVFDLSDTPNANSWETNSGEQLWAVGYRYTGPTYQPTGSPSDGQVMSYNDNSGSTDESTHYLEWSTVTTSGGGGTDPLTVVLTNPNSFVACDANGNPDTAAGSAYTNTATDIKVFRGTTQLTYNSNLGSNKWKVHSEINSGINLGSSNSVDDENHAGYDGHHTITSDNASITYYVRVQNASDTGVVQLNITQNIHKLKKGSTGNAGADAYSATLSNEAHAFHANVAGTVTNFTGSKTSVRAYKGTQELDSVSTTPTTGEFKVTRTVTTGTYTPGSEDITGDEYISNDGTIISSDVVVVEFSINCENNTTIVKEQKLVKVYKGDQGVKGDDGDITQAYTDMYNSVVADKATVAADKATVASDKGIVAADKATVASDKGIVAADKATVASDKAAVASDKTDAQTAASNASGSATTASAAASTATTKAGEASTSASNAATSATTASGHATTATTKASEAATSKTAAETAETNAETAESNASGFATTASGHATTATTQAGNASTSATAAASSANTASGHATTATTKASEASTSASNASTSETNASGSATDATNAKTAAETAETNAVTAKNDAVTAKNDAVTAKNDAVTAKNAAEAAETSAEGFRDELTTLTTSTSTVPVNGSATSSYNSATGVLSLGLPTGATGSTGPTGPTGPTGLTGAAGDDGSITTRDSSAPGSPSTGDIWYDTSTTPPVIRRYDGSNWIAIYDIGTTKSSISSTSTDLVTGAAVFDQYGGSAGGASELDDLSDVLITSTPAANSLLYYDQTASKFKPTKVLNMTSVTAGEIRGVLVSDTNTYPTYKFDSVTETVGGTSTKQGRISTMADFIIQLDASNITQSVRKFRIQDGAGNIVFSVDENGKVGQGGKFTDSSGNDKIEYETNVVKIHDDVKSVTGKFIDNSDVTRIDYSGTTTKISGDVQYSGGSPATISGPDADKLNIESTDDLDFKIASGGASSKSFKFYNNTTEVAKITSAGNLYSTDLRLTGSPSRIYDTGDNVVMQFSNDGSATIYDPIISTIKTSGDMSFQIDYDEGTTAGTHSFQFKNGAGTEIANLNESGDLQIDGDLTLSGLSIMNADSEVTISVDADQNAIFNGAVRVLTGTLKNLMGNTCITMDGSTTDVSVTSKLTTGGNIELGHASDTTIARSAAGTVTIEGKEVVTKNKIYDFKTSAYFSTYTNTAYSIPFGGTLSETTYLTNNSYSNIYVAPFDGRVVRIVNKEQQSGSGTSELELFLDHSSTKTGSTISVGSFTYKFEEDCPADWTFSKGETIAIKRTDTSYSGGTSMTIVFEFDATT